MKFEEQSSNLKETSNINLNGSKQNINQNIRFSPIDELQIRLDQNNGQQDKEELSKILAMLNYPSSEIAEMHSEAMKLGNFDLEAESKKAHEKTKMKAISKMQNVKLCPCCGFKRQVENIELCTPLDAIANMGTSTVLFFQTFKNLSILLAVLTIVFSIYALATNIIAAKDNTQGNQYTVDYLTISLASKQKNNTDKNRLFYFIQAWIGMATMIIWIFVFFYNRYRQFRQAQQYDSDTISASDYTVIMSGMPLDITETELQNSLDSYYKHLNSVRRIPENRKKPLKVMKLNIAKPFYLTEDQLKDVQLEKILKEIEDLKEKFRSWIQQRQSRPNFSEDKTKREQAYKKFEELLKQRGQQSKKMQQKITKKLKQNNSDQLTSVFVTFDSNIARNFIIYFNDINFFSRIKAICGDQNKYSFQRGNQKVYTPAIIRAPQPEDIIWTNIGRSECNTNLRKIFTYTVTAVLLGVCFAIVYALSRAQQDNGQNRVISIAISIVIALVNTTLGQVIKFLTIFEKDYTSTNRQASLAVKSIVAQMINSILIPVIVAYYIKTTTGVYKAGGLVDNIFIMAFTNSLIPPILLFFDPFVLKTAIFKCLKSRSSSKLFQTQKEHNSYYERLQFEVGFQYIYIVNLFMFVCFFVSLQPIVPVIALLGYLFMYWVEKYCLFHRYRRPVPGTDFINKAVYQLIFFGPLIYSLGSLTWANFDPNGTPPEALLPNLLALLFSILLLILPMNTIIEGCVDENAVVKATLYQSDRMFFPSEYDRVNPSTTAEGIEDYKKFMEKMNVEISKKSKEEQEQINRKRNNQMQRGMLNQANIYNPFASNPLPFMQPVPMMAYQPYNAFAGPQASFAPMQPMQQMQPMQMQPMQMQPMGFSPYQPAPAFGFAGYGNGYGGGFGAYGGGYGGYGGGYGGYGGW